METNKACCVFGHRKIEEKKKLKIRLSEIIENLITRENVDTFYFGSRSEFDDLCREVLLSQKKKYPHIKRIYVRAEYPHINEMHKKYLLLWCEETYFPDRAINSGKGVYIERNYEMIDKSDFCVVYFREGYLPPKRKNDANDTACYQPRSGTAIAFNYAVKKNRTIINLALQ